MPRSLARLVLLVASVFALAGCGSEDIEREAEKVRDDVQRRIDRAEREFEERRDRYGKRIERVLGDREQLFQTP